MTEIMGYCPSERNVERKFRRVDKGIALVGTYECTTCGEVYRETNLNPVTRNGEG